MSKVKLKSLIKIFFGQISRTETTDGDALFQALTGFACNKFSKLNKVNKTTKILK